MMKIYLEYQCYNAISSIARIHNDVRTLEIIYQCSMDGDAQSNTTDIIR